MVISSECRLERLYQVLEYTRHRLAEMNSVLGRLQSVAGVFVGFSITAVAFVFGLGIDDVYILATISVSSVSLFATSIVMVRESMVRQSHTADLGTTPWFYRGNITFQPTDSSSYDTAEFNSNVESYKQLTAVDDDEWINGCARQILQLFVTCKVRMTQIRKMTRAFYRGLLLTIAFLPIGFTIRLVLVLL